MPTPNPSSQTKRVIGLTVVISVVLITIILGVILQSTRDMFGKNTAAPSMMQGEAGYAVGGAPAMIARDDSDYGYEESGASGKLRMMPPIMPSPQPGASPEDRARLGEKIIRNGSLTLRVDDAAKRLEELRMIVTNAKGFVASASMTDNANVKTAYVTVRVPNTKFDEVRMAVKALATTVFVENETAEDVTAQFVDLDARLTAAKAEEQQYLEILKKAGTIEDTLNVTQRLADVRSRIEQMQGQLRYMNDQTTYATLTITLTEEAKVVAPTRVWKPLETFKLAVNGLIETLQGLTDSAIVGLVFLVGLLLPIVLVIGLVIWIVMKIVRRISKK